MDIFVLRHQQTHFVCCCRFGGVYLERGRKSTTHTAQKRKNVVQICGSGEV